jgi:magnesium-transporting ATPase (P-type)
VYGLISINCLSILLKELKIYVSSLQGKASGDIQLVINRLNAAYIIILSSSQGFFILLIIFASYNYLFHLVTYLLILMYATVPAQTYILVVTVTKVSHSDSTSKQTVPTNSSNHVVPTISRKQIVPTIFDEKA